MTKPTFHPEMLVDGGWYCQINGQEKKSFYNNGGLYVPENEFETKLIAERVCRLLNYAYKAGQIEQQRIIREALGL